MIKVQHAIGALVGSAVGDALGPPFEFERPGVYNATYPSPVTIDRRNQHRPAPSAQESAV